MKKNKRKRANSVSVESSRRKEVLEGKKSPLRLIVMIVVAAVIAVPTAMFLAGGLAPPLPKDRTDGSVVDADTVADTDPGVLTIRYPVEGTLFPPDIASPTFVWKDTAAGSSRWTIGMEFGDGGPDLEFVSDSQEWEPSEDDWAVIKRRSVEQPVEMTVSRFGSQQVNGSVLTDAVLFSTSTDAVGAPIFYREVNLPFSEAIKDPGAHIRWRFGSISTPEQPPVVLDKLMVCGNCHSFSADGAVLGMDVDYANDKGSYVISSVEEEMRLVEEDVITWNDYKKEDEQKTFGLLSQVSPDGRYVVSTVKDLSVFRAIDNLEYSQLFFPIRGILCVYDRETGEYMALSGADDPNYVQSNPTWSPDGKYIVFARDEIHAMEDSHVNELGLTQDGEISEFMIGGRTFRFDLYRVPFNEGQGGQAEPLLGASDNGRSNYFAKYSPDGRWIVFCQADQFMLLQPDSELFIIPAEGGEARRMACNTNRMNSWHSWSPNGRWLVFSSKWNGPYTQLMLTHVDESGCSTPPVVLSRFTVPTMAGNIPEFVNTTPDAIRIILKEFLGELHHIKAGDRFAENGMRDKAIREFQKALDLNPESVLAHQLWGVLLMSEGEYREAESHLRQTVELDPDNARGFWNLGKVLGIQGMTEEAVRMYDRAIAIDGLHASTRFDYGILLLDLGREEDAVYQLTECVRLDPKSAAPCYMLGDTLEAQGKLKEAFDAFSLALQRAPKSTYARIHLAAILIADPNSEVYDQDKAMRLAQEACEMTGYKNPLALVALSDVFAEVGNKKDAIASAEIAFRLAQQSGRTDLVNQIRAKIVGYKAM